MCLDYGEAASHIEIFSANCPLCKYVRDDMILRLASVKIVVKQFMMLTI